jgi:hypothetical protein
MLSGEVEVIRVRVLVAFEDTYRAYGDAIVRAIRNTYPRLEVVVAVADLRELEAQVALFDPHLVISSRSSHPAPLASRRGRLSRVKLSVDPDQPSLLCINGQRWESLNPSLEELLDVVNDTESMLVGAPGRETGEGEC